MVPLAARLFFLFCALTFSVARAAVPHGELYSEQLYQSREAQFATNLRLRAGATVASGLYPYIHFGTELMTLGQSSPTLDPGSSYAYAGPGLRWSFGDFALLAEPRARLFYRSALTQGRPALDMRGLLVYNRYSDTRELEGFPLRAFSEVYGEAVFTSADASNVIVSGFARAGGRLTPLKKVHLDAFVEPYGAVDRLGHYYYNRVDLRPSLRLQFATADFSASLIGSYVFSHYLARGRYEANPYAGKESGFRLMAVVGGSL